MQRQTQRLPPHRQGLDGRGLSTDELDEERPTGFAHLEEGGIKPMQQRRILSNRHDVVRNREKGA
jgi:hypothetical protein